MERSRRGRSPTSDLSCHLVGGSGGGDGVCRRSACLQTGLSGIPAGTPAVANDNYDAQAAYMIPFYKLFLESDERYRPYLYGAMRSQDEVTRYETSMMQ